MKPYAALVLSLGVAVAPSMLQAQDAWPARPITFLVPYGAGGYTDLVARLTGRYVEEALGRPVIVDTRPGAGGIVGTQAVVNAAADGYMFCVCSIGAISIAPFDPNQKVGYDPVRDLAPVGLVSSIAQAVVVKKDLPVTTMAELVSYAKANPGKLNYGSSGAGGLTHYSVELFRPHRHQSGAHPVQGRCAVHRRGRRRRGRFLFRQHDRRPAAGPRRISARLGRDVAQTQPLLARSSHGA